LATEKRTPKRSRSLSCGLFTDESLLASKGVIPSKATVGYVDGYGLRISRRATLVPDDANRAYGVLMALRAEDVRALYSPDSRSLRSFASGKTQTCLASEVKSDEGFLQPSFRSSCSKVR
jgi:hypothetical protein